MAYKRTGKRTYRRKYPRALGPKVRRIVSSMEEKKFVYGGTNLITSPAVATPLVLGLLNSGTNGTDTILTNGIPQGATVGQRIGNRIKIKEIKVCLDMVPKIDAVMLNGSTVRIALVHDKKPTGNLPAFTSIFRAIGMAWLQEEPQVQRFKILKQIVHQMVVTGTDSTGAAKACGPPLQLEWTIRPNKIVSWDSASVAITNLITDNWYIIIATDAGGCCDFYANMKIKFTDA